MKLDYIVNYFPLKNQNIVQQLFLLELVIAKSFPPFFPNVIYPFLGSKLKDFQNCFFFKNIPKL